MKNVLRFTEFINESLELNEAFKSSILKDLSSDRRGNLGKEFFSTLSAMGIAASDITDLHITQVSPSEGAKITKSNPNAVLIYYSSAEKANPYAGRDSYGVSKIAANIPLAIVKGGKFMGLSYDKWASKGGKNLYSLKPLADVGNTYVGKKLGGVEVSGGIYGSGLTSLKRMADVSDVVYVIDPANVPSSTDLRHLRKEAKSGAVAFINDKDFKNQNVARYNEILKERAANDDIDKVVADAIETLTQHIKDGVSKKQTDDYGNIIVGTDPKGRSVKISDAGHIMNQILNDYSRYVEYQNSAKIAKERHERDTWYTNSAKDQAKSIKDRVKKIDNFNYAW